ncbi:AMP-binding protein [Streptomyces sp. S816]|uniref:fatty acyl-AMP ligase n=1 Tax=Streptomyces sp. S816 TaxID=2283197 RepID=UPI00109D0C4F|nr:fatty acyl-AMP ligase [Streptomyces sp. S816]TGZ17536.1 AMP-binding protein [Streptomyces sp. S816]
MPNLSSAEPATFTDVLRARGAERPQAEAHVELRHRGAGVLPVRLSYGELDLRARRIASMLQERRAGGTPVLLLYTSTAEFLSAYAGCLYAGAVAVPAPLPDGAGGHGRRAGRVRAMLDDTGARLVLAEASNAPEVSRWLADTLRDGVDCLATDRPELGDADAWRPVRTRPDDLAFLQYTSGSVREPRGVMVSHRNLMDNQRLLQDVLGTTARDRFGGWLPHYHDMGFIAHLLHPVWLGGMSVCMAPEAFVRRPMRWLRAIDEYGVTVGGGPNFCYDLCVDRVSAEEAATLDLSSWRLVLNGAEPVRPHTLRRFTEHFAGSGLRATAAYPCYGLAEATLLVSGGTPGAPWSTRPADAQALEHGRLTGPSGTDTARELVDCGPVTGYDVRIVEPEQRRELPAGRVGEIWLRGDSVAQGYWKRPEESEETFRATLDDGETGFLRTGDLGVLADGRLYVTGRLKELIILNGRNLYPQDVEWTVREAAGALRPGAAAAFCVDAGGREQLALVLESRAGLDDEERTERLVRLVQEAVGTRCNAPLANVLLVGPGAVPRTTSGKVRRAETRRLFLAGELPALHQVLDPAVHQLVGARRTALGEDLLLPAPAGGGGRW